MKKILLAATLVSLSMSISAQLLTRKPLVKPLAPDSIDLAYYSKKNAWRTVGEIAGFNIGLWGVDRYILKGHYAYISFKTMKTNLAHGFVWDNDQLSTNMFAHPYTGSLYYNAARSNGYDYWASLGFAAGGSLMWEFFLENEYPSLNDFIATPVGGAAFGEITYRASDLVLDDRKRGSERFASELAGFAISPTRGLTRILNGDAWRVRSTSGRQFGTPDVNIDISAGIRAIELKDKILDSGVGATAQMQIEYGDRFDAEDVKAFDQFSMSGELNFQKRQPILGHLSLTGRLAATELINNKKDFLSLGVYQHFDYFDSDTISSVSNKVPYKLATPAAFGVGLVHKSKRFDDWRLDSYAHLNAILLGASLSDHYIMDNRNYNLGSGFGAKVGVNFSYKDIVGASWSYEGYRIYTWKGYPEGMDISTANYKEMDVQGDKSKAFFDTSSLVLSAKLKKQLYLTYQLNWYGRITRYAYYDKVKSFTNESLLMLTYRF